MPALPRSALLLCLATFLPACNPSGDGDTTDQDGDGVPAGEDCDDTNAAISPAVPEKCDAIDNDCDGATDEGYDFDVDGYFTGSDAGCLATYGAGNVDCFDQDSTIYPGAVETCNGLDDDCSQAVDDLPDGDVDGWNPCEGDCDDTSTSIHPDATEQCDGRDNDCNDIVDDGFDLDGDGSSGCGDDCNDDDDDVYPGATEVCDGLDNDCDLVVDNGFDGDGDGQTSCGGDCDDTNPELYDGAGEECDDIDNDCDGAVDDGFDLDEDGYLACGDPADCNDLDPAVRPGGVEVCDGLDNDCDGSVDEEGSVDADLDGWTVCAGDCQDGDPAVHPGMEELCNGYDDDCDNETSEIADPDGDGYTVCTGDCVLTDGDIWPGAPETCDQADSDCDGLIPPDEVDGDGDGEAVCQGDCDDGDPALYPGAPEDPDNGVDDDCDGAIDEVPSASGYVATTTHLLTDEVAVEEYGVDGGAALSSTAYPGGGPTGVEVTPWGTVYVLDGGELFEVDPGAGTSAVVPVFGMGVDQPDAIALLPDGMFALTSTTSVWLMDDEGHAELLVEEGPWGGLNDVEADIDGDIIVADSVDGDFYEVDRDTGEVTLRTPTHGWTSLVTVAVEPDGDLVGVGVITGLTQAVFRITPAGDVFPVSNLTSVFGPTDIEVNPVTGNYLVGDGFHGFVTWGAIVQVTPSGTESVLVEGLNVGPITALAILP